MKQCLLEFALSRNRLFVPNGLYYAPVSITVWVFRDVNIPCMCVCVCHQANPAHHHLQSLPLYLQHFCIFWCNLSVIDILLSTEIPRSFILAARMLLAMCFFMYSIHLSQILILFSSSINLSTGYVSHTYWIVEQYGCRLVCSNTDFTYFVIFICIWTFFSPR